MSRSFFLSLLAGLLLCCPSVEAGQPLYYSIQVATFSSLERASHAVEMLTAEIPPQRLPTLRIEQIGKYFPVRVGRFADSVAASELIPVIHKVFPDAEQMRVSWQEGRILQLYDSAAAPPAKVATDPVAVEATPPIRQPDVDEPVYAAPVPGDALTEPPVPQALPVKPVAEENSAKAPSVQLPATKMLTYTQPRSWSLPLAVLSICIISAMLFRQRKKKEGRKPVSSESDHQLDVPGLSKSWELRLQQNQRELSAVEGNLLSSGKGLKTFYLSSCFHGEGKTTTAVSLAYGLAEISNKKVLLVDGNSHAPRLHTVFGTPLSPGGAEQREKSQSLLAAIRQTVYPNLSLLTYGQKQKVGDSTDNQIELIGTNELLACFDYVIVDGNSALGSSQLSLVAKHFDGILLVVECERTKWEVIQQVKEKVEQVGGQVVGVILNKRKYYIPRIFYGRK